MIFKNRVLLKLAAAVLLAFNSSVLFSQNYSEKKQINDSTVCYKLNNGLDLFVSENHTVPLVYIEVAVRTGAVTQTPKTAGLFHLFEHMMFKGNSKYKDSAAVQKALSELGVSEWNGSTGIQCVNYYFTVPSSQIKKGLEFWNYAIREPLLDEKELEAEKKVVVNEISSDYSKPERAYFQYIAKNMFPDAPWQLDPSGTTENVLNCTVRDLVDMKNEFYVPDNTAVFVGGDCDAAQVLALVNEIWGDWKKGDSKKSYDVTRFQTQTPFSKPKYVVFPYDKIEPDRVEISINYRGPDSDSDPSSTYPADLFTFYCASPESSFKKTLLSDKKLNIPSPEYIGFGYHTLRRCGRINIDAIVNITQDKDPVFQADAFYNAFTEKLAADYIKTQQIVPAQEFETIRKQFKYSKIRETQTADGILKSVRGIWCDAGLDYFLSYEQNVLSSTNKDIAEFLKRYISGKNPVIIVVVNKTAYEQKYKDKFDKAGYECITKENSFWFEDKALVSKWEQNNTAQIKPVKSYTMPSGKIEEYKLSNGIPVFYQKAPVKNLEAVYLGCRGSIMLMDKEYSGLERSLFDIMCCGSKKYSCDDLRKITYETSTHLSSYTNNYGSVLYMDCVSECYEQGLDMLLDAFLNPAYEEREIENLIDDTRNNLVKRKNDPQSILFDTIKERIYKDHPYQTSCSVTEESFKNLTVENMKNHHKKLLDSRRLFVVVCGNTPVSNLLEKLESSLGKVPALNSDITIPHIQAVNPSGKDVVLNHPECKNRGFFVRIYNFPDIENKEYISARIAMKVYDENLFNIVREQAGACYSTGNSFSGGKAPFGFEYFIDVQSNDIVRYAAKARTITASGKLVNKNGYDRLENRLEGFKNSYINERYSSQKTTAALASRLASSIMEFGEPDAYDRIIDAVHKVTAKDVLRVFNKYWVKNEGQWYMMLGPED